MRVDYGYARAVCRWLAVAAVAVVSVAVQAATEPRITKTATGYSMSTAPNSYTVNMPSSTPNSGVWTLPPGGAAAKSSGNWTFGSDGAGKPTASTRGSFPTGTGKSVPVDIVTKLSKPSAAAAIGRFAAKIALPLQAGIALYDLAVELGYTSELQQDGEGANFFKVTGGVQYLIRVRGQVNYCTNMNQDLTDPSMSGVATQYLAVLTSCAQGEQDYSIVSCNAAAATCQVDIHTHWNNAHVIVGISAEKSVTPEQRQPVDWAEIDAKMQSDNAWNDARQRALRDAVESGEGVATEGVPTATGPATVTGSPVTTTETNSDGTSKQSTSTPTANITYNGPTFNITNNNTTVTNSTNIQNQTSTSTVTQTKSPDEPKDPCETNADRAGCAKLGDPLTDVVPKDTKNVSFSAEDMGWGSGSCPINPTWQDILGTHTVNLTPYCDKISSVVRPVVLALAALMALAIAAPGFKGMD